ncbi:unnamed protein product [Urochloa decumbens]|uniref:PDZ domain-containing protein n=1 Tax=Urochloa decumbens TaxID=240449 RepID=A0ABC8ZZ36_9POAL
MKQQWIHLLQLLSLSAQRTLPDPSGRKRGREGRRRRRTATTSSPHQDVGEGSDAAVDKNSDSSSEYISPLRRPKSLMEDKITSSGDVVQVYNSDPAAVDAYHKDFFKYQKKLARLQELPTLKKCKCAANITDWHDLKKKNTVLDVAESVLSLSSSHDGKEISGCSGVIIEWVEFHRSTIVVTSSQIICTKRSLGDWEDNNVYVPNAKVTAHLLDGTTSELTLLCFSKHYDISFFELMGGSNLQVTSLEPELEFGSEACVLARDKDLGLICRRTTVKALDPMDHQKNHYLFIGGSIPESCTGGALTDFNRNVLGMVVNVLPTTAFIPSSLILGCLRLWQKFKKLARPHLGLKLRTVEFLDISHLDQLSRNFKIRSGLIVGKVSSGSYAERNGIRVGDIIFSCQGEIVSTISQFEGILLDICAKQFEEGNGLNSKLDVELGVFNVRKPARRMVTLSVELSDWMEAFN